MARTLNELEFDLKNFLIDIQSDSHNKITLKPERYNNLTFKMNVALTSHPHVKVFIGMSAAEFDLRTGEKIDGGLGPDEKYVVRWIKKAKILKNLNACWTNAEKNRGRIVDKYGV